MDKLVFQTAPTVELGSNTFTNVPVILQFDQTPLIQVVRAEQAGFTTEIPIYHNDGTYLTKVVGSRLHTTKDSVKAGVSLEHHDKLTVCKMNGKTLFEIRREEAASLKTAAELYTPEGYFVKYSNTTPALIDNSGQQLKVGGVTMIGCGFNGVRIGVWIKSNGTVTLGCR